jgi:hypothetical protein
MKKSTVADHVVTALSPALVMGLVGSLTFFLVEVFYGGAYGPELRWELFFFVFGAVLCARISLMGDIIAGRAPIYAGVLGVLVWIGTMRFISYPPGSPAEPLCGLINAGLVGLIYWSAYKVTRDCTDIGGEEEVSGDGLLQAAGLDALDPRPVPSPQADRRHDAVEPATSASSPGGKAPAKKRTPGVWVVYFSLAALPLFGLGQAFIPAEDEATRERAFWMLVVYTGCGLGLLLTTCFLGLRQYLRQRKLRMPAAMTATWLTVGGGLIAVLLLVAFLLPRPWAETGPFRSQGATSEERDASDYAQNGETPGEGEGRGGGKDGKGEPAGKDGKGDPNAKDGKGAGAKDKDGQGGGKDGQGGKGAAGKDGKGAGGKEGKDGGGKAKEGKGGAPGSRGKSGKSGGSSDKPASNQSSSSLGDLASKVGPVLKWIVFGLLALLVLVFVLRGGLRYLANFSQWARDLLDALRNFWARLFAGRGGSGGDSNDSTGEDAVRGRPFADYPDPFADGSARRLKPATLIRYAFEALQAWAAERDLARRPDETPAEFARRLGDEIPAIDADARQLAALFARAAYAPGTLPAAAIEPLRGLWHRLEAAAAAPLSALVGSQGPVSGHEP